MLGESLHITSEYLTQETKVASVVSKVEALEAKNSKLKKDLIAAMDEANTVKGKIKVMEDGLKAERQLTVENDEQLQEAKEKIKTIAAKLLRRYFVKHPTGVDLENLDLEEVNKEMAANEAFQSTAPEGDAPESALPPLADDDVAANA